MEENLIYILPAFGIIGLLYMLYLSSWVKKQSAGSDKMQKLAGYIATGALTTDFETRRRIWLQLQGKRKWQRFPLNTR